MRIVNHRIGVVHEKLKKVQEQASGALGVLSFDVLRLDQDRGRVFVQVPRRAGGIRRGEGGGESGGCATPTLFHLARIIRIGRHHFVRVVSLVHRR